MSVFTIAAVVVLVGAANVRAGVAVGRTAVLTVAAGTNAVAFGRPPSSGAAVMDAVVVETKGNDEPGRRGGGGLGLTGAPKFNPYYRKEKLQPR